jgi:diguanylate cyclase (GGDEF)-like protein
MRTDLFEARRKLELDPLTGIYNRGAFDASIDRYVTLAQMTGQPLTLMMVDLDHFKKVNDTHGHPIGDRVLKAVCDAAVRSFPRKDDLVARYGGEELAVVLLDVGPAKAPALAARLLDNVRKIAIDHDGTTTRITCSVGVAHLSDSDTPATLVACADAALYRAKKKGRDRAELAAA